MILGPLNVHRTFNSLDVIRPKNDQLATRKMQMQMQMQMKKKASYAWRERVSRSKLKHDYNDSEGITDNGKVTMAQSVVTPSMNAVMTQVRQSSKVLEREFSASDEPSEHNGGKLSDGTPISTSPSSSSLAGISSPVATEPNIQVPRVVETFTDPLQQQSNAKDNSTHLTKEVPNSISKIDGTLVCKPGSQPHIELYNMEDLDLSDCLVPSDIISLIPPIYKRNSHNCKHHHKYNKAKNSSRSRSNKQSHSLNPETPRELKVLSHNNHEQATLLVTALTPRKRQRSMNPNFLKLMAIENSSIKKEVLPEVVIDVLTFDRLAQPVGAPGAITVEELEYPDDVKLAIRTKLKIWNHLCKGTLRSDVFGDSVPSRLNFVNVSGSSDGAISDGDIDGVSSEEDKGSSIVRVNSDVTPWVRGGGSVARMLQPCGTLSCGSQYVVKGWCDARFR